MRVRALHLVVLLAAGCTTIVVRPGGKRGPGADAHDAEGVIVLDGARTQVRWADGDSFTFLSGAHEGSSTRLVGYNTLEAYGPVHRWGSWSHEALFELAKKATRFAASKPWECRATGERDAYRRLLVDCPQLAREMARRGLGLAYAVFGLPPAIVVDAMHQAQREGSGMWAGGVPEGVVTALHPLGEDPRFATGANRVVDMRTGEARLRKHVDTYATCQEVCVDGSCMVWVPAAQRYDDAKKPPCLSGASDGEP